MFRRSKQYEAIESPESEFFPTPYPGAVVADESIELDIVFDAVVALHT